MVRHSIHDDSLHDLCSPDGITAKGAFLMDGDRKLCWQWETDIIQTGLEKTGRDPDDPEAEIITKMQVEQHGLNAATLRVKRIWCKNNQCSVFKVSIPSFP